MKKNTFYLIQTKKQLNDFLITENNSYAKFIKEKLTENSQNSSGTIFHMHHIIPLHYQGFDEKWNLIRLSLEDHIYAHKLLYINYGSFYDLAAFNMLQGQQTKGVYFIQKQNQLNMKEKKIGFYNSNFQRELATRPRKKRKPFSKNFFVKSALKKGFLLNHIKTKQVLHIKPFEFSNLTEVIDLLMQYPQMKHKRSAWNKHKKKEKAYEVSALTRILTGHIDPKTGKSVYSFSGWQLLGVFL